ncbi:PREDICTED: uncharacterized protein LOC106107496 [Papilio polytes]|uniref:uncharacterized protein LOC106107496 n=1 Tax=Papilio polytes TaxID=76194 RepID=UPI000675EE52|nr:PREDICTED: uncharacterized protein LOC106107496 [Papilio polytes]
MASGDSPCPQYLTYSKSRVPLLGALIDYVDTSIQYLWTKSFVAAEQMHVQTSKSTLSISFLTFVCLVLGLLANVKMEVVTIDESTLEHDLHIVLLSEEYKLYVDDIDVSKILCCIEASDTLLVLISCFLICNSGFARHPTCEYMYLPWMGVTLRGLALRQLPTCAALLYTMYVANEDINTLFLTSFALLFITELRLWLEVVRLVCLRWEANEQVKICGLEQEVKTLWSNEEVPSIEVSNFVY